MITVRNITLRRGAKVVLGGASFTLNPGEKAGLVGRNGAGKSSLFALLTDRLHADAGDVELPPRWRIGEVAQHMPETEQGATDYVLDGDLPLVAAKAELAAADAAHDGEAMAHAHLALEEAGAFDARARAQALLLGLGFKTTQLDAPVNSFSGGWRMRLQLARALMCPADLLLLDEPTNHLDLDALVWLEAWLQRFAGTLVVISHDREFLDAVTKVTLHVDHQTVTRYGANYSGFEEMRAERMSQQAQAFAKQQERIAHLQKFIDRFKAKATKAKQAQSRVKALARMEKLAPVLTESEFDFEFREPANLPNPMLVLDGVSCGYGSTPIVNNVNRTVLAGQRIGILGANGQGKSTLVKTIARALPALGGRITEGKGLQIGYFAQQEMDLLTEDDTPLQRMTRLAREVSPNAREQELRNFLGQFNFGGDMVHQKVG
ncbi:MAG: ATP-binding cassette domain-containing protein, partial [Aquincola sp.]|nr:ATP-binding cassette domain-containing protein [Aquincola sp.]